MNDTNKEFLMKPIYSNCLTIELVTGEYHVSHPHCNGAYLFRDSQRAPNAIVLSFLAAGVVNHVRISKSADSSGVCVDESRNFDD